MRVLLIAIAAPVAFALALGGVAKLVDPLDAARFASRALWLDFPVALSIVRIVSFAELALGVGLSLLLGRSRILPTLACCVLAFFAGLLVSVILSDPANAACGCFGSLMGPGMARRPQLQLAIDLGLISLLLAHCLLLRTNRPGAPSDVAGTSPAGAGVDGGLTGH